MSRWLAVTANSLSVIASIVITLTKVCLTVADIGVYMLPILAA